MAGFSILLSVAAFVSILLSFIYVAFGLGIMAIITGYISLQRQNSKGSSRLVGAGAMALGSFATFLTTVKYVLALLAISQLESMF